MKKNILIFIFSLCILALSVIILSIGPITNKKIGENWGYQNCDIISDQIDILNEDTEKLKKMDALCRREKAMYDLEYCAFIINIIASFICADLALLEYMGISKDFDLKAGLIAFISGIIGFILTLVYICYSGYIFTNDIAYMKLNINYGDFNFNTGKAIEKLYSNGASLKWDGYNFIPEYYNDRDTFSQFIKYKDLGKSQYNYDSEYYKKYQGYIDANGEVSTGIISSLMNEYVIGASNSATKARAVEAKSIGASYDSVNSFAMEEASMADGLGGGDDESARDNLKITAFFESVLTDENGVLVGILKYRQKYIGV
jgi:hypothetical protein